MVTKILRLSQITNGGPGSGESEGHEFRGNQYGEGSTTVMVDRSMAGSSSEFYKAFGDFPSSEQEGYMYHSTLSKNIDKIKESGLVPMKDKTFGGFSSGDVVSLSPDLNSALYWSRMSFWAEFDREKSGVSSSKVKVSKPVLLRISDATGKQIRQDEIVVSKVDKSKIDIWDGTTWKKLTSMTTRIVNSNIEDSISSIVKQYLESNVDSTLSTVSSSHIIGALTAKGNLQENPTVSFDLLRQQSLDYAMEHTKEIIEKGGSTIQGKFKPWLSDADNELRSSISTVITDGINKGKSRDEIKRDLKSVYDADDVRIDRIAGWEIPDAQYQGAFQQYDEDGVTIFEWLLGDSPCEVCEPYGEKRFFTADELPDSLLHPSCMCDIAPVVGDQITSMVHRLVNGGEGSGEHEGHEFRGNQYDLSSWGMTEGSTYKSYRGGQVDNKDSRGIFVAPDEDSATQYAEKGESIHEIEVTIEKPLYAKKQTELTRKFFDKDWQDMKERLDRKTSNDSKSNAIIDAKIAKAARQAGYKVIVYTEPWAPAKKEIVVLDPSLMKETRAWTKTNISNLGINDSISSIVKQYLDSNVDSTLSTVSSSHINGGEGSGEHEGHEFRGNQWGDSVVSAKESLKFERGSSAIFSSKMSNEEMRDRWDSISNIKGRNIDDDEIDALRGYQQSEYSNMNEVARTGEVKGYPNMTDSVYNMNASMDLAIEHGSQVVPPGIEMWRGIGSSHGLAVASMEVGDICKDEAFQSFSIDPYVGGNFARVYEGQSGRLEKTVIRAISTGKEKALGGSMTERELIFSRGTSWQVVSKESFGEKTFGRSGMTLNVVTVVHHG